MTRWQDLTEDQRNELIASTFFGWKPVQCDGDTAYVSISEYNAEFCHQCYASTDDWQSGSGKLVHGVIPVERAYTSDITSALQVAEKAREMLPQAYLTISLQPHGIYRYSVSLVWAISVQDEKSVYLDKKQSYAECNLDKLAETICFVLAQAVGAVESEEE